MAWDLTIGGVSKKSVVMTSVGVAIRLESSERSTARFQIRRVSSYLPARFDEVLIYDKTATLMYGGIVMDREVDALVATNHNVQIACADWWTYLDWSLITLTYTAPVTTKTILTDLIAALPGSYGFTLAAGQVNGLTYDAYASGVDAKASDILRGLAKDLGYRPSVSPAKVIEVVAPGTVSAPFSVTTATPHCQIARWRDPSGTPANRIVLRCGPSGVGDPVNYIWTGNAGHVYALDGVGLPASSVWPGIVTVAAVQYPIWPPGSGPTDRIEWDYALNGGTLTFIGAAASIDTVGASIGLNYSPQFPFTVVADAAMTPVISEVYADESIIVYEQGVTRAAAILAERNQAAARELMVLSRDDGWRPDQTVTVALTQLDFAGDCTIGAVDITITSDDRAEVKDWVYQFTAVETDIVPGSTLDVWRQILGTSGTGTAATTIVGGGGSGGGGMIALPSGQIYVGNAGNVATAVAMSGDATIDNAGVVTVTGGSGGMTTLPTNQIYVGNGINIATAVAMSGDITIVSSGATDISAGVIVDADINAAAAIVDTKLATIATAGKVSNSATTANTGAVANTIALRDTNADIYARALGASDAVVTPLVTTASGALSLQSTSGVVTVPSTYQLATGYSSGFAGAGYTLNQNLSFGSQSFLELDRLSVRGVMNVYELLVHQIRATNGSIFISSTGRAKTVTSLGGSSYRVVTEGIYGFAVDDLLRAQRFTTAGGGAAVYQSDLTVTAIGSATQFDATLRATFTAPAAGMDYVRLGSTSDATRRGSIYLTADDTHAPYINILDGVAAFTDWGTTAKIKGRIGNLNGSMDYIADVYGAAFGDYAAAWLSIEPIFGIRMGHNTTIAVQIDASGNASFAGTVTAAAGAIGGWVIGSDYIRDSVDLTGIASTETVGDDVRFYAGSAFASRGTAPFRVYQSGAIAATSGTIGGWNLNATTIYGGTGGANTVGLTISGATSGYRIWAGDSGASVATAPFRVHEDGSFVATNATITGAITATSGSFTGNGSGITSINGGNISAGTVTATQIAANTITASQIAANTITAAKIAAGTITATEIASDAITTAKIDAGAVTASEINVSTLSAISANLGTITAGTISGTTFYAGGTDVVMDSNGLTLAHGGFTAAKVKWTDGSFVVSGSNTININATSGFAITTAGFNLSYMGGSGDCYVYVDNGGTLRQGASYP